MKKPTKSPAAKAKPAASPTAAKVAAVRAAKVKFAKADKADDRARLALNKARIELDNAIKAL